jgi:hypothetical protein
VASTVSKMEEQITQYEWILFWHELELRESVPK